MNLRRRMGMDGILSWSAALPVRSATACRKGVALVLHRPMRQINRRIEGDIMAVANFTSEQAVLGEMARQDRNRRAVRIWLGFVLLALFCLVIVGGATRLTNSGLSITQ